MGLKEAEVVRDQHQPDPPSSLQRDSQVIRIDGQVTPNIIEKNMAFPDKRFEHILARKHRQHNRVILGQIEVGYS